MVSVFSVASGEFLVLVRQGKTKKTRQFALKRIISARDARM